MSRPLDGVTDLRVYYFELTFRLPLSTFKFGVGRPVAELPITERPSAVRREARLDGTSPADPTWQARSIGSLELRGHPGFSRTAARSTAGYASAGDVLEHRSRIQGRSAVSALGRRAQKAAHGGRVQRQS